jgi:hypothetical protein
VPAPKAPAQQSNPATTDDTTAPRALPVEPDATTPGATADAANIPVAQPVSPSDQGVTASDLQPPRATPVKVTSTISN